MEEADNMECGEEENNGSADSSAKKAKPKKVYIPGASRPLKPGEELEFDSSAYTCYHRFDTANPCLSFDTIPDVLGSGRETFPLVCYIVAGTQAENIRDNSIIVIKLDHLDKNKVKDNEDESSSSESEDDDENSNNSMGPSFRSAMIGHHGGINRLRVQNHHVVLAEIGPALLCANWNDQGKVHVWNLATALRTVDTMDGVRKVEKLKHEKPLFTFSGHSVEGFALDWCCTTTGRLASGDSRKNIYIWNMIEGGTWSVNERPLSAHNSSVEDIQWSPSEEHVLCSCSSDKSIRLWDTRAASSEACVCTVEDAHNSDVNVISWNASDPLIVSGCDDGILKIWDLRMLKHAKQAIAKFAHHKKAITTVSWNPNESTVLSAAGEDDQLTIWDLALEPDPEAVEIDATITEEPAVSPQLLFIHQGQKEIKELRWHPQLPGIIISTALDGFNLFRPINV